MSKQSILTGRKYYLFEGWSNSNLVCAFSTRQLQNMSLFYGHTLNSLEHRQNFLEELGIDYRDLVCTKQVHASQVRYVQEQYRGKGALSYDEAIDDTDALITDKVNLPLAVFTADCLSIFFYDPIKTAIGLAHAGWRSTKSKIAVKTVQMMQKEFNTLPCNLYVGFGPAIRECCYEVRGEFKDFFPGGLIERDNHCYLDLVGINKRQLLGLGIKDINIFGSGICTSCQNERFFSYRKEGSSCGRMMSVIMLR